jgi:hypothetical protein
MRISRILGITAAVAAIGMAGVSPAKADFTAFFGNTVGGDNILFNFDQADSNQIYGVLNNDDAFHVNFKSTDSLHPNGGQARVEKTGGTDLTNLEIFLDAGLRFTQYVFTPMGFDVGETMHIVISGFAADGITAESETFDLTKGHGDSPFITVLAMNDQQITNVKLSGASWLDNRQNRIGGASPITTTTVPEGSSLLMIGGGGLPLFGVLALRRRRK